jgi:YihY family inner membrane protein
MELLDRVLGRLDRFQRRHAPVALPIAVSKRFGEHDGSRLAATVSYYSFFSVFPLMLVFVTVLGIVLEDNDDLREDLIDGAVGRIPLIGTQLADDTIQGSGWVLVFGLLTAIWAGMAAVSALQHALDIVADIPVHERPNYVMKRVRALVFLVLFGIGICVSTLLSNVAAFFDANWVTTVLGLAGTFVVNALVLAVAYSVLPARLQPLPRLLPGIVVGGVLLLVLQLLANLIVDRLVLGASDVAGTFATVLALLTWFHLVSRVILMSAQLNEVLADDLSPRRLLDTSAPTDADRRATMLDVQRIQRDPRLADSAGVTS